MSNTLETLNFRPANDGAALRALVSDIVARGYVVSVNDGGAWPVKRSQNIDEICDAASSVDEARLAIRDSAGEKLGIILLVFGNDPSELVADFSWNPDSHSGETGPMFAIDESFARLFA